MGHTYFFTGFPGFIARGLIKELIAKNVPIEQIYLLVLPQMKELAKQEVERIVESENVGSERFAILSGDITVPGLALSAEDQEQLRGTVSHVFHLAAIYDLAVPEDIAYKVNVIGTKHVNEWVESLTGLKRYVYFSTAYVSGTREGRIYEHELEMSQSFKNHYEKTKYEAEVLVKGILDRVPTTIIRPGVVKGHSKTGETIKYDGPYFILNLLERLKFLPIIPYFGSGEADGNFVPLDYIYEATIFLTHSEKGEGKTYHLTDPSPYKMKEVYAMLMKEYLGKKPVGTVPLPLAKMSLSMAPMRKWLRVEKEAMDYFTCKSYYDNSQAQEDLKGSGVVMPDFKAELAAMVRYYREHKDDESKHIAIR